MSERVFIIGPGHVGRGLFRAFRASGVEVVGLHGKRPSGVATSSGSIPANAAHSFTNTSKESARLLCICAPAGREEFFGEIGVRVSTRTTPPPMLDKRAQAAALKKAEVLTPKYRTELLKP